MEEVKWLRRKKHRTECPWAFWSFNISLNCKVDGKGAVATANKVNRRVNSE